MNEAERVDYSLPLRNKSLEMPPTFGEPFHFTGDYETDKADYLSKAVQAIKILSTDDFNRWLFKNKRYFPGGTTGYFFIRRSTEDRNVIVDFDCAINEGMFNVYGEDFTELIPIDVLHELLESWQVASRYQYPEMVSPSAHFDGRVAELLYAIRKQLAQKY